VTDFLQGKVDEQWQFLKGVEEDSSIDKVRNARLIRDARASIGMAQDLIDRGRVNTQGPAIDKDIRFAFDAHLKAAYKSLIMACGEDVLLEGLNFKSRQSESGLKGADIRWKKEARIKVNALIDDLRKPRYSDWRAKEKWDKLISLMNDEEVGEDREKLDPQENWIKGDADKSTIRYNGDGGKPLTYKTFKNRLSS